MAFTTLPTYGTGDTIDASHWNTYVKDNFATMPPDIFTATGEIMFGEGADTGGLFSPGNTGEILIADSNESIGVKSSSTVISSKFTWANYTNTAYDGDDTFGSGSNSINVHDTDGFAVPSGAVMLFTTLKVAWNAGSTDDYIALSNTADTDYEHLRIDYSLHSSTYWMSQSGIVVPASGNILLEVSDSSDVNIDLYFTGYVTT